MRNVLLLGLALVLFLTGGISSVEAAESTGLQIMNKVDANMYFETSHLTAKLVIKSGRREMVKEFEAWGQSDTGAYVVFTNPSDRGTKYLKLNDELWMFFPDADDLVKISGHMLNQGMMGSDFSYSDAMESEKMTELYSFELLGEETVAGRLCYVIEANALPDKKVSYTKRKSWIDKERYVAMREELYAASGKLLKVVETKEVREVGNRYIATNVVMSDQLKRNSSTSMVLESIEVGIEIPDGLLSLRSLMK